MDSIPHIPKPIEPEWITVPNLCSPASNALALGIKSLIVRGSVLNERLFGGCDRTGAPVNANVQSGDATVGSDWIASTFEVRVREQS
jgi:hypothetical protein